MTDLIMDNNEKIIYSLRSIYRQYGYSQYKMSKFEEYDLYSNNKSFLVSDSVITFTDTDGKLMALKPDVTLSIVKNNRENSEFTQKLYYNENVYRVSKGTNSFKELMQVGLECIGTIDDYCVSEVLLLARESLKTISDKFVLDVADLDILSLFVEKITDYPEVQKNILKCVEEKNVHGIDAICQENGIDTASADGLKQLISIYGNPEKVLPKLKELVNNYGMTGIEENLENAILSLECCCGVNIDFSVVSDINYYNGIVFKGFIENVPGSVLTGGQYDRLMEKMNCRTGAIGFAVYLDALERLNAGNLDYDIDVMAIYDDSTSPSFVRNYVKDENCKGHAVVALREINPKLRYKTLVSLKGNEVTTVETNA